MNAEKIVKNTVSSVTYLPGWTAKGKRIFIKFGIVDILQWYSPKKILAKKFQRLTKSKNYVSLLNPEEYKERLLGFLRSSIHSYTNSLYDIDTGIFSRTTYGTDYSYFPVTKMYGDTLDVAKSTESVISNAEQLNFENLFPYDEVYEREKKLEEELKTAPSPISDSDQSESQSNLSDDSKRETLSNLRDQPSFSQN